MNPTIEQRARTLACMLAGCSAVIAVVVLAGYALGAPLLVRLHPTLPGMSPLTAVAIVLLAIGIDAAAARRDRVVDAAVLLTIAIVGIAVAGHFVRGDREVSPWVVGRLFDVPVELAGHMSTGTALALLLVSTSLAARRRVRLADVTAGAALLIVTTGLLAIVYRVEDLDALTVFVPMALNTAVALLLLGLAMMLVEPRVGWSSVLLSSYFAGGVTRRQIGLLLLPALVGWVLREGTVSHQLGTGAALALLVILTIAPMALLVLRDGRAQIALDIERRGNAAAQASMGRDLENRLARNAEQLERASAERSKVDEAMYRMQRVEAIGQLTGGIAHDFNNLLAAIGGNLELMLRKLREEHLARRYAVTATAAVGKGAKLAGQLLAFSRGQRLAIAPTQITPALKRARTLIGSSLGPTIELLLEYPRDDLWAQTDSDQLELALFNLAVNARDAMPRGGQLRIESSVRVATLSADDGKRSYVVIRVSDDGVGMTANVLAKSIEPFFTTRERGTGTGLGLAQVYGFVRQCGGDLHIESAPGQGTVVEILLPLTPAPVVVATPHLPEIVRRNSAIPERTRLLVIDDDDTVRGVLVELLTEAGYDVSEAIDGASALVRIERIRPHAAVIDFLMPGMNGAEVARRAQDRIPHLPIVFVSGYSDTAALDGISGAVVLRKPFRGDQLQAAVESALEAAVV